MHDFQNDKEEWFSSKVESWVVRWNEVDFVGFNSSRQLKRAVELIRINALDDIEVAWVFRCILNTNGTKVSSYCLLNSNNYLNKQPSELDKPLLVASANTWR